MIRRVVYRAAAWTIRRAQASEARRRARRNEADA